MNFELANSHPFPCRTSVLRGGKAPAQWKRELSRETDRLVTVLRTCGWVKAVAEVKPSFFEQPLLGNCLAEITSRNVPQSDVATTEAPQTKRHSSQPPFNSKSRAREITEGTTSSASHRPHTRADVSTKRNVFSRNMDHPASTSELQPLADGRGPSQHRKQSDNISQLPARAGTSLLKRLAGPPVDTLKHRADLSNPLSSLPHNQPPTLSPVRISSHQQQDWRQLLADRAAKTWLRDWPSSGMRAATSTAAPVNMPGPDLSASSLLEEHWATTLFGQRAAPETLRRLAKHSGVHGVASLSAMTGSKADWPSSNNPFPAPSGHAPSSAKQESGNEEIHPGAKALEETFPRRDRSLLQEMGRAFHSDSEPNAHTGERIPSSKNFAPPALTLSMPDLLPAVGPGAAVLPIAAETARYGAWRDEVSAPEKDLSLLAAQVKRILDEEARRHGIDV